MLPLLLPLLPLLSCKPELLGKQLDSSCTLETVGSSKQWGIDEDCEDESVI